MEEMDIIEPSRWEWSSPIVPVKKMTAPYVFVLTTASKMMYHSLMLTRCLRRMIQFIN